MDKGGLAFLLIDIIYSEECTSEGGCFSEGYKERGVDLALRVDEDATKEQDEASDGEDKGCDELEFYLHKSCEFQNLVQICPHFWRFCKFSLLIG